MQELINGLPFHPWDDKPKELNLDTRNVPPEDGGQEFFLPCRKSGISSKGFLT